MRPHRFTITELVVLAIATGFVLLLTAVWIVHLLSTT